MSDLTFKMPEHLKYLDQIKDKKLIEDIIFNANYELYNILFSFKNGEIKLLKTFLTNNPTININIYNYQAFRNICSKNDLEMAKFIYDKNIPETILHNVFIMISKLGYINMVKWLCEINCNYFYSIYWLNSSMLTQIISIFKFNDLKKFISDQYDTYDQSDQYDYNDPDHNMHKSFTIDELQLIIKFANEKNCIECSQACKQKSNIILVIDKNDMNHIWHFLTSLCNKDKLDKYNIIKKLCYI